MRFQMTITTTLANKKDFGLLFKTYQDAMLPYISKIWGWNEELQTKEFLSGFPLEKIELIHCDHHYCGFLIIDKSSADYYLWMLIVVQEFQNRGIGRNLLGGLLQEAKKDGKKFKLNVFKINLGAKRFFEGLGFVVLDRDDTYFMMQA